MGLGKTIQTISFLNYIFFCETDEEPFLVICPGSVVHNWVNYIYYINILCYLLNKYSL